MNTLTRHRLPLVGAVLALCLAALAPAARADSPATDPARELARTARPLDDLRALDRMIGPAKVVGIGEATHSSAEFFAAKHRIFEHLVEKRGFTTFALEANWSTGLLIDDYVRFGKGDIRKIMREEFQNAYGFWNTEEYLDLFTWMRRHNVRHPRHPVRFMGNDLGHAGAHLFATVTGYVGRTYPRLLPRFEELYRASRPVGTVDAWMNAYLAKPREERRRMASEVGQALALLERQKPGPDREEHTWMLQHARVIAQVGTEYAHDMTGEGVADAMLYRDRIMAENTVWWQRTTGDRMVLSAHNGHVGYETTKPDQYPRLQGAFLRDALGRDYVSVGASFGRGSFNAHDTAAAGEPVRRFTVGLPGEGSNAETLDRVSPRPFLLDVRTAAPAARSWLNGHRASWLIGTAYPWPGSQAPVRLATAYDVVLHFPEVSAARLR
ncbi:erythromycin esterase family protein [Streptomyces sp. QHH-9511]|uniref:erythromycin esterase family protein n=1 Tax=Streptomyces sp. QHH-9511 TaxID=2684468 RepID=UPI001316C155|nr:erythromycin esterase family protein [Streptomyces sp. QHH-9511]QGZ48164.1 erythromycin esterase family protein [Streptomyces sp. QHH-9511]